MNNISIYIDTVTNKHLEYTNIHINEIDSIYDGSCDNLYLADCPDYVQERTKFLDMAMKKVSHEGTIHIKGLDYLELAEYITTGFVDSKDINKLLYPYKRSISNFKEMKSYLEQNGFDITLATLEGLHYSISAKRK